MYNSRRDFLKASGLVVMAGAGGYLGTEQFIYGADDSAVSVKPQGSLDAKQRPTIVTIFLRGGADALNAIVPYGDDLYHQARSRIGLSVGAATGKGRRAQGGGCVAIGDSKYWGLNARLSPLIPMIENGQAAAIINTGSMNPTRSHFSAQDYMERGVPGDIGITTGWLNRYLEMTKKPYDAPLRGLSAQTLVPRALRGSYPVLAGNNTTEQMDLFENLYSTKNLVNMNARSDANDTKGTRLDELNTKDAKQGLTSDQTRDIISQSGANAIERIKALEKAEGTANDADYPGGGLGNQLATIARVIKANVGLEVAQADYGGWDTHSAQGGAQGGYSNHLGHLADCLVAFNKDLGSRMDRVLVLVMSEFGRTVQDNGASGTDHGRGGFMLAMGNMCKPAPKGQYVHGIWKGMEDLDGGRFLPVHTDFRLVFGEALNRLYGIDPIKSKIFPELTSKTGLVEYLKPLPPV
jgi:uncharacterized protein (DUF1501 family)